MVNLSSVDCQNGGNMKITIENEGNTCTVETGDVTAVDILQCCLHAMLGVGFHPESVKEAVLAKAEEIQTETE